MKYEKKSKSIPRSTHMRNTSIANSGDYSSYLKLQQSQLNTVKVELKNNRAYIKILNRFVPVPPQYDAVSRTFDITYDKTNPSQYGYLITNVEPENSLGYIIYSAVKSRGEVITIDISNIALREVKCNYNSKNQNLGSAYMDFLVIS